MKCWQKIIHLVLISIALSLLLYGCVDEKQENNDLSKWLGDYRFYEYYPPNINMEYSIYIYKEDNEYYADIYIDGFQTDQNIKADILGNLESIDLIFKDYLSESTGSKINERDILLSFKKEDSKIYTYWGAIQPILPENMNSGKVYFEKATTSNTSLENDEPFDQGEYYIIYKITESKYMHSIYNIDNQLAFSSITYRLPLIEEVSDELLEITIGVGTGTWLSYYFDARFSLISTTYECPRHIFGNIIAYMVDDGKNIRLILKDAFGSDEYYFEIVREFSKQTANISDNLLDISYIDENNISIEYLSGDDQEIKLETVNVPKMQD